MKKLLFLFLLSITTLLSPATGFAGRYKSLKFTSNDGETYTIATNNLEILVSGEAITFSNTNLILPLSSLVSMEFTDYDENPAAVDSIVIEPTGAVMVYDINGLLVGSFDSYQDALESLREGVFVIKDTKGNSLKISVGK